VSEVRICDWIVQGRPHAAPIFSESPLHLFTLANDAGIQILGEGDLRNRQDEALRFALCLDLLDAFTIGAESKSEQEDLIRRIAAA